MNYMEQYIFANHEKNINKNYEDFAKKIMGLQNADTFTLLFATDMHYTRNSALHIPGLYKLKEMIGFSKYVGVDLLGIGGDIVNGNTTIDKQYSDIYDMTAEIRKSKTTSVVIAKGNHDDCSWYAFKNGLGEKGTVNQEQWYSHVINPLRVNFPMVIDKNNPTGGYYYIDYPSYKIRVININTSDYPILINESGNFVSKEFVGQWCLGMQEKQLDWFANVALKLNEEGWSALLFSHSCPLSDISIHNRDIFIDIIKAFQNNEKGCVVGGQDHFKANISYDFTNNASNDVLFSLCGHKHGDFINVEQGITVITTRNLMGDGRDAPWDDPENITYGSWDCMLIDKFKRKLISKRYNQPQLDREILF